MSKFDGRHNILHYRGTMSIIIMFNKYDQIFVFNKSSAKVAWHWAFTL